MSELSHEEPPWRYTEPGGSIRYETAFIAKEQIVTILSAVSLPLGHLGFGRYPLDVVPGSVAR